MKCIVCNSSFYHQSWSHQAEPCDCGCEVDLRTSWDMDPERLKELKMEWKKTQQTADEDVVAAEKFVTEVMTAINPLSIPDQADVAGVRGSAARLYSAGYTVHDAVLELLSTEEVNPELPEHVGLARIHAIRSKYFDKTGHPLNGWKR